MSIKIAITDDHPMAISGIQAMLSGYKHIEVTQTYHSGAELMAGLEKEQPDVLLLDILLPDKSGRDLAPVISRTYPSVRIIAITSLDAPAVVQNMIQHGCLGYLLKGADAATMVHAIEQVSKGEEFIEPSLREQMLNFMLKNWKNSKDMLELTPREKEILKLIVEEHTSQEISEKLFISFRTAETHRYSLMQKLGVKNTVGLVKIAMKLGLVDG